MTDRTLLHPLVTSKLGRRIWSLKGGEDHVKIKTHVEFLAVSAFLCDFLIF